MIIIGVDPGIAKLGYGVVKKVSSKKRKQKLQCLDYGLIETHPSLSAGERLKKLNQELNKLIRKHQPKVMAVENVYFFKNLKTIIPVSQAKGVVLLTAARKKIPVFEITPLQAKMAITGYGRADKKQVQKMLQVLLELESIPKPDDAADALACAICASRLMGSDLCQTYV